VLVDPEPVGDGQNGLITGVRRARYTHCIRRESLKDVLVGCVNRENTGELAERLTVDPARENGERRLHRPWGAGGVHVGRGRDGAEKRHSEVRMKQRLGQHPSILSGAVDGCVL
jgi:hypothetical protein